MEDVTLFDRIKETTHITGTSDVILEGAVAGFSAFLDYLPLSGHTFYAITDGSKYEVGSGTLFQVGTDIKLSRNSVRSSESDNSKVSFVDNGLKEVYATYPGVFGVVSNPFDSISSARKTSISYWSGAQTLDSDPDLVWIEDSGRVGINTRDPRAALDIEGNNSTSTLRVSGITLGASGIDFVEVGVGFSTGRQREPFFRNRLSSLASGILELSGVVKEEIHFRHQTAGTFLGVTSGECPADCGDKHPTFRKLEIQDIPNLSGLYVTQDQSADKALGNVAFYKENKHITYSDSLRLDTSTNPDEFHVSGTIKFKNMLVSDSGIGGYTDNTIVNNNGLLVVPTYDTVADISGVKGIPETNVGAIAFASGDSYIMIANGNGWVSGQLI
tara:strand:+ start:2019 stop:3176 length:1158 start_codon:yes stop_codon:yes gene_type:complete